MKKSRVDNINRRCDILLSLGFVIEHADSQVRHPAVPEIVFDFSATDETKFFEHALSQVMKQSRRDGANDLRRDLAGLLAID